MTANRSASVVLTLMAGAFVAAGCGSSSPGSAGATAAVYGSPVQAALSWFSAINHKDQAAAAAHFEAAAAGQMNWGNGNTSGWPTFSALHCRQLMRNAASASVYCGFSESQAPDVGNPDSFWTISLVQQPDKQWLITNYGQG